MAGASSDAKVIEAGGLKFAVEYRQFGGDRGSAIRVYGSVNGVETQLLRFDCFEKDPHYHYDPDGKNQVLHLHPEFDNEVWSVDHIEHNLKVMVRLAGYPEIAERINTDEIQSAVPKIRKAMSGE